MPQPLSSESFIVHEKERNSIYPSGSITILPLFFNIFSKCLSYPGTLSPEPPLHLSQSLWPTDSHLRFPTGGPCHKLNPFSTAPYVSLDAALATKLIRHEVCVVRRVNEVVVHRLCHILVDGKASWVEDASILWAEVAEEAIHAQHVPQSAWGTEGETLKWESLGGNIWTSTTTASSPPAQSPAFQIVPIPSLQIPILPIQCLSFQSFLPSDC